MSILRSEEIHSLDQQTIVYLQQLAQANIDSAEGFRRAAEAMTDKVLAADFRVWAVDRTRQADELAQYIEINQHQAPEDRSWMASLHQTWMDMRAAVSAGDTQAVLAEVERGEDMIKSRYEEALKETSGSAVNSVLQHQYAQVKGVHDRIRDLRNTRRKE